VKVVGPVWQREMESVLSGAGDELGQFQEALSPHHASIDFRFLFSAQATP